MKFFIDTANLEEIEEMSAYGIVDGVTTNPSIIAREGKDLKETLIRICNMVDGPISGDDAGGNQGSEGFVGKGNQDQCDNGL